ncbi:hypothetical protein [Herbiconiux daphne]|uniref:Uncharacterized protein n=1 Tax=Herbiconiux daphne TaxID=2970914 RepID=A0ABT2H815_9MICO|nr:hypothetical protein [Herbiconiux daphne]MCS5736096.1 hypothetical protein [Herbiconiux daphne]
MPTDLIGNPLTEQETMLLGVYEQLKTLEAADLAPSSTANVRVALSAIGIAVGDLGLVYEHLTDRSC